MDHSHHNHHHEERVEKKEIVHEHQAEPVKKGKQVSHAHHDVNPPMGHEGHDHHAMMIDDFKKRFWVSLILTIPVLLRINKPC